eukprot:SAG11_NODE_16081_length_557_cov_1.010917_1_plen_50_part_01
MCVQHNAHAITSKSTCCATNTASVATKAHRFRELHSTEYLLSHPGTVKAA